MGGLPDSLPPLEAGPRLVILQEGVDENRLRAAVADDYVKFSSRLNMPCIALGSELIYGTAKLIDPKSGRSVTSTEELGFNDSCHEQSS